MRVGVGINLVKTGYDKIIHSQEDTHKEAKNFYKTCLQVPGTTYLPIYACGGDGCWFVGVLPTQSYLVQIIRAFEFWCAN